MTKEKDKKNKRQDEDLATKTISQNEQTKLNCKTKKDQESLNNKPSKNTFNNEESSFANNPKEENKTVEIDYQKELALKETKILELLAEKENLTKRLEKEKQEFLKYRAGSFLNQIIPSIDMMEKALAAKNVSPEVQNWLKGFEMIFNNFITSMEKEGVKIIITKPGDYYDPKYHHAIDEQYSDDYKAGQIIKAHNHAYLLHDRLLRPASVIVAKSKNISEDTTNELRNKKEDKNV